MSEWDDVTLSEPDDDAAESPRRRVIELDLGFKELAGEVPSQLAELTDLESLYLRNNEFTGPVPSWIGGLANLEVLDLRRNEFTGSVPSWIGSLVTL